DNDGVLNDLDQCSDTPSGARVDASGCPIEKISVTLDVKFDAGKSEFRRAYDPSLEKVADFMKRFPDTTVLIEGHTDNVGSAEANKRLSQKRAEAVRTALVNRFGIRARRVTAKGFGAERPILDNGSPEGRAANRRVVATISTIKK
nr:OmpA family protein [Elusimicrobiota bacterium]